MAKLGKDKIALFLACASVLGGKTQAMNISKVQNPQTIGTVGGARNQPKKINWGKIAKIGGLTVAGLAALETIHSLIGRFTDFKIGSYSIGRAIKNRAKKNNKSNPNELNKDDEKNIKIISENEDGEKNEKFEDLEMEFDYDPDAVISRGYYEFTDTSLKKYVLSELDNVNVNGVKGETLKQYLMELCEKFSDKNGNDYTKGWPTGEFTGDEGGGEQAPWEYFFVKNNRFAHSGIYLVNSTIAAFAMDDAHKALLAKEIILMRDHIDDPGWKDVICSCLVLMCTHGGQCAWRATSIVDNIYFALNQKAYEITGKSTPIFDIVFSKLKNMIINRSFAAMKKYMETGFNNDFVRSDPLGYVNPMLDYLKFKLGISQKASRNSWIHDMNGIYINYADHGEKLLKKEMCALRLFMLANRAMQEGVTEEQQNEAAPDVELSFEDYCKYTMKSESSKQKLLNAVADLKKISPDGTGAEEILPWINGRNKLSVLGIIANLGMWAGCKIKGNAKELYNYLYGIMPELRYLLGIRFIINCCEKNYLRLVC